MNQPREDAEFAAPGLPFPANAPHGLHVIAELFGCRGDARLMTEVGTLRAFCLDATRESGLTVVGDCFYQFQAAGVTGAVLLAESHLAIHTWPEKQLITVDLYVCNLWRNNDSKALWLFDRIVGAFRPDHVSSRRIDRNLGEARLA